MPFTFDGTSLPVESQLAPDEIDEFRKYQQQKARQQQAPQSPQQGGGASKPTAQAKPQQQGPQAPGQGGVGTLDGVGKFVEQNIAIPVQDFIDNTFQGNQQTPDEIARQRAEQRIESARRNLEAQRNLDAQPGAMLFGETLRGVAGGAEDLVEGVVNLPGQVTNLFGTDFKPVNFGLVRENSTTAGKGLRTLSRYVMGGLGVGAVTRGGLGAGVAGSAGFGLRATQGFVEDFVSADGTSEDGTLIGSTEFTKFLQTSDSNNPIHNRALVGIEGALFEAVGAPAVKAFWRVSGASKAINKLGETAQSWSKGAKKKQLDKMLLNVERELGIQSPAPGTGDPIQDLLNQTRQMLTDPKVLQDQRKARAVAEYHRMVREVAAPRLAKEAQIRLKTLLANTFANDQFGSTLDYTRATERDLALRLIQEDPSRRKLNTLITQAAETVDETDPVLQYLRARADAYEPSKYLDDVANTVKYGGDPDEKVFDVTKLPEIQDEIARIDQELGGLQPQVQAADQGLALSETLFNDQAKLGGQLSLQIADLQSKLDSFPTAEELVKQSSIKLSLSKAQAERVSALGFEVTPGRRVQGLNADNIEQLRSAISDLAASGDKVAQNLASRLDNIEVPAKNNFQSREAIQQQLEELTAKRNDLFSQQVADRTQRFDAQAAADRQKAAVERLQVEKQAITARMSGNETQFTADYVPVNLTSQNVTSINKERGGGQPGFDLYFEDKRFPALLDGRVKEIGRQGGNGSGYGNYVVVESIDPKTGQTVDVLYAHLADGSLKVKEGDMVGVGQQIATQGGTGRVVSADGTIASVDFLAPAAKGSKSMAPYARWSELVDELSASIQKGEVQPSQVGRKAPSVTPEVVEGAARRADELVPVMSRSEAVTEAGFNVDQVAPVQPRTNVVDDFVEEAEPVVGTAAPGRASLTDMDVYSLSQGAQGLAILENTAAEIERRVLYTEAQTIEKLPEAVDLAKEFLSADDDGFLKLLEDDRFLAVVDGNKLFTTEGLAANGMVLKELQRQAIDLSESVIRNTTDGSPQAGQDAIRLLDRLTAMLQMRTVSKQTASGKLREFDYVGRNLPDVNGQPQIATPYLKKMQEDLQNQLAKEENLYNTFAQLRTRLASGDKAAFRELEKAARVMQIMQPTQKNFRALQTALASVGKGLDGLYVNSILSGPVTMQRNFWGNFYQSVGHPMQALLGSALPGKGNEQVRRQAIASLGAIWDTRGEFVDLFGRMYQKQWNLMGPDAKEYVVWDEKLAANMALIQQKIEAGEVGWVTAQIAGLGINIRKVLDSPFMRPMMAFMGATDNYFQVLAGRQVAAQRAVQYALDKLGDAPLTAARAQKFGALVTAFKDIELKKIFSPDGLEVTDPEAVRLGQQLTFQTPIDESDVLTRKLNDLSSIPGMKFLGVTFVKTPSNILKSAANLTPGISTLLKNADSAYKNGDAYYRAMRDGAEAMSYIIGGAALAGGMGGAITGAGPLRGEERDLWLQNHKPFTITIGKAEFNYQALEPASSVMGMFADMGALLVSDDEAHNFLPSVLAIISSNIINKSYLAQVSTIAQLVNASDPKEFTKVFENMGRGLIPYAGLRSQVGSIADPAIREVRSELEEFWPWAIKKQTGLGMTKTLPQRVDPITGDELTRDGIDGPAGSLVGFLNLSGLGLRMSRNRFKPVHRALDAEGYDITNKTKQLAGEKLTNEEMVEYNSLRAGKGALEKELLDYFNGDQYKKIDKPNSQYQREQGIDASKTDSYAVIDAIVQRHHTRAVGIMEAGLTAPSAGFAQRLKEARQKRFEIDTQSGNRRQEVLYGTNSPQEIINNYQY